MSDNGKEEVKVEDKKEEIKEIKPQEPPKDFKIAEIWIKDGQLILDASPEFWNDKLRALGVMEYCKDIIRKFEPPKHKVMPVKGSMINNVRKMFGGK